jgi:single-stranded DNA-specific DHH superfamily exonuclease
VCRHLRRLRCRRRDVVGPAGALAPLIHIPDRLFEGYGPNVEAVRSLAQRGAKLIVTVDCGTSSLEPLQVASELNVDVVVIDHHLADEQLPRAVAVVNPNRPDDLSGLTHLAAVGLTFLTIVATNRELRRRGCSPIFSAFCTTLRSVPSPTSCRSRGSIAPSSPKA